MGRWWTPEELIALMAIAKAEVSSRKAVPKTAPRDKQSKTTCGKPDCAGVCRKIAAKLLLVAAIAAVDATADPGVADSVLGDAPAIACYMYGPQRAPPDWP